MPMSRWVQEQMNTLGGLNDLLSPRLHKLLRENHNIRLLADSAKPDNHRGTAIFAALDPWNTCLRVVPGSFKYFRAAQQQGIISGRESLDLSLALIGCCRNLKPQCTGRLSYFFEQSEVAALLACDDEELLLHRELISGTCADTLYQAAPWPVRPTHHLVARTLPSITFARDASADSFSALTDAIEFANWGPWIGFSPQDVINILFQLQSVHGDGGVPERPSGLSVAGRRMMLPFFSSGFQGIVVGFFIGIDNVATELIRTELMQYGQTLADKWSMLRRRHFKEALHRREGPEQVAQSLVQLVSPVDYVVLRSSGGIYGYRLQTENGYWAGYKKLDGATAAQLIEAEADIRFDESQVPGFEVAIKTLPGHSMFDPIFTRARLQMIFDHPLAVQLSPREGADLSVEALWDLKQNLEEKLKSGAISHATLRQLFVVKKVIKNFSERYVSVSNNELKGFFETRLRTDRNMNGYQISSHLGDVRKIFPAVVSMTKTRNGVTLRW
ncbi:MAG: hypothetical protein WBX25_04940 [Rhodomicrobium sp.]